MRIRGHLQCFGVFVLLVSAGGAPAADDAAPESDAPKPVVLSAAQADALGVVVVAIAGAAADDGVDGYAQVLDAGALVALLDESTAALATTKNSTDEAARMAALQRGNDDVSRKAVAAAATQAHVDRARSDTLASRIALEWSPALSRPDPVLITDLRRGARRLLRIEFGAGAAVSPGSSVQLQALGGHEGRFDARVLGAANGASGTLVGPAWLAVVAAPALHPGERLRARSAAAPTAGTVIPASAIVYAGQQRWVFVENPALTFARRALPVDAVDTPGGVRVADGFARGDRVVIGGAAAELLSVERAPAGEADDDAKE